MTARTLPRGGGAPTRPATRRAPSSLLLAAVATIAGWPYLSTTSPGSLDDGYYYVFTRWLLGRFDDTPVVFTCGPLGTLNVP